MANTRSSSTSVAEPINEPTASDDDAVARAGQQAGESIGHVAERATELGFRQADSRRQQLAQGLQNLAGGIRRASNEMQDEQPAVASVAQTAAEQTDRVAEFLRETDAREIVHNVEEMARRQPLLFLGGAFVLGLAASRLLKAGGSGQQAQGVRQAYRSGYGTGYDTPYGSGYSATGPGTPGEGI